MAEFTHNPAQTPILENACRDTIESALNLPGILDAGVALYDADGALHLDYAWRRDNQPSPFAQALLDEWSVTYQAIRSGQAVHVQDFATNAPHSPATRIGAIDAVMAAPVIVDDRTLGALVVTAADREALTAWHRHIVDALADRLGLKLANQILQSRHSDLQNRHDHLQQLYEALRASNRLLIGPVRTVDELYEETCRICVEHADFALAWIARPNKNGWFRTLAVAGPAQGLVEDIRVSSDAERPEGHGSMGRAWRSGEAAYLQAPRAERRYQHWHAVFETHGIYGIAAVPLKRNGQVDAVLAVGAYEPDYFGEEERLLFEEIGTDLSEALGRLNERVRTLLATTAVQHASTGVLIAEAATQRVLYSNAAMARLTGHSRRELRGRTGLFFMPGDPIGRSLPGFEASVRQGKRWQGAVWGRSAEYGWEASVEVRPITGPDGASYLLALFGPRPEAPEARLRDSLTGLPNAESCHQVLARRIDENSENGLVLIRIGVRDLTAINRAYGRAGGDQVLLDLTGRLRQSLPKSSLLMRLGGDSFAILTRAVRRDAVARIGQHLLRRVEASVEPPFEIEGYRVPVRLITGVAFYPGDAQTALDLLAEAEMALNQDRYRYPGVQLTASQPDVIRARLATAANLRHALNEGHGIQPWYQPKVCLHQGHLIGAEALARWQDADRGLVSPGEFLPLADALGVTGQMDRTMRDAVLHDLACWRATECIPVPIAINLSAGQLTDNDLTRQLLAALDAHDLPAELLHVEITEHDVISDVASAQNVLQELEAAGIEVSLDDFGTGYSSLSILRDLPLTQLKLDKSFIDRLGHDSRSLKVARLAIELAHELGIRVIAEGIESQNQADILRGLGCDYAQGFFFARPMPASDFREQWLREENA